MKRISLLALSATVAMAQTPVTAAEAPATPAAKGAVAPLAPIHDNLIFGNPALPGSMGYLMITPSDFYGKREVAFQWAGSGSSSYNGMGLAVVNNIFVGFGHNDDQGELAGGYIASGWAAGLRLNRSDMAYVSDISKTPEEATRTEAPTGFGLFGSAGLNGGLTAYGRVDWTTPDDYESRTNDPEAGSTSSRSDSIGMRVGVLSEAKGDKGVSFGASVGFGRSNTREAGETSDDAATVIYVGEDITIGKTFTTEGYVLAVGLNQASVYRNGKGLKSGFDPSYPSFPGDSADWGLETNLVPNIAISIPLFEHWTLSGGAGLSLNQYLVDAYSGDKSSVYSRVWYDEIGLFGIRYEHGRWAAEAQVANGFLNRGPNFISGAQGNLFASFGLTVNFK